MVLNKRKILTAAIASSGFLLLTFFYYHIDKILPWWGFILSQLLIAIAFSVIVIGIVNQCITLIKNRSRLNLVFCVPVTIYLVALLIPNGSSEIFESKVKFRACYEGTQNQATIKFRNDNTFELHWTGVFFSNKWYTGRWNRHKDTLTMSYSSDIAERLGKRLLISRDYLAPLDTVAADGTKRIPMFYLGYCKGEN